jgi:hypothetical protein
MTKLKLTLKKRVTAALILTPFVSVALIIRVLGFVTQLILDTVEAIVIVSTSASELFETKIVPLSKKLIGKTHD